MFFKKPLQEESPLRAAMTAAYRCDETQCVQDLLNTLVLTPAQSDRIRELAREWVVTVRQQEAEQGGVEALMRYYDLSTEEGIVLMCIAEALLRIPDKKTQDLLIQDKLTSANWREHLGNSRSTFVNLATWGLAFTGKILEVKDNDHFFNRIWKEMLRKGGEPLIRQAVSEAVKIMSQHFVLGRSIKEAVQRSKALSQLGYSFSYDMLGEVARTAEEADRYFKAYQDAIKSLGEYKEQIKTDQSISVKLSALYARYEFLKRETAIPYLTERLKELCQLAVECGLSLTVDAEESDRLEMSLQIIENVFSDPEFKDWNGLGLAVQAYQKRALSVIAYLIHLARSQHKRINVRLVKGAYWDTEIKMTQVAGLNDYPVFTRKTSTDVSYLTCAQKMLAAQNVIYPQFATHNAHSVSAILTMMDHPERFSFEFQKLQGMGTSLHDQLIKRGIPCRIYAPVGSHKDLLPYLVRRLLENGANSSFVNRIGDSTVSIEEIIADPVELTKQWKQIPNPKIPLPSAIYGKDRLNSAGVDLSHFSQASHLSEAMSACDKLRPWLVGPLGKNASLTDEPIYNPARLKEIVGYCALSQSEQIEAALQYASEAFKEWNKVGVNARADILLAAAQLLEENRPELMTMAVREAGKVVPDALSEVREAVDFCRYYAQMARSLMADQELPGPTGEKNVLRMRGRGPILCISPWNFPIAIFTGQIAAALVTGNTVIAKPAEQTPIVAARIVELFHKAGVPKKVLHYLPGTGEKVGQALVEDERISGIIFTGSTATAKGIQNTLAKRKGPLIPLIAETGGINAMIVDSSALPEQVVRDVIQSAFGSAGQRCSALRLLCLQEEIADGVIRMLGGAMKELEVGDPQFLSTDVGPVIDEEALSRLEQHVQAMEKKATLIARTPLTVQGGHFIAPQAYELNDIEELSEEVFGPILHVLRYRQTELPQLIDSINAKGYGLTFGIQSRIDHSVNFIAERVYAGNIYVNRNMIGAVVGVQPFGGSGLSGTGPKAGGPHYLARLCTESTLTIDTTAAGGNASLMILESSSSEQVQETDLAKDRPVKK